MDIELYGLINSKLKGKASLVNGKVPADQLPSYVDDVINGYYHDDKFYEEDTYQTEIPAEEGKIYVDLATNLTYRWSGLAYIQIGGITVEANPTLVGTEPELTGLQIGDAKYKMPEGSYIVTPNSSNYITSDEFAYIKANYQTVPCFIAMSTGVYRIILLSNDILFTDGIGQSVSSYDATIVQYKIGSTYKVEEKAVVMKKVSGNPTLAGTEAELTGLQIGNTKYKLGYLPLTGGSLTGDLNISNSKKIKFDSIGGCMIYDNTGNVMTTGPNAIDKYIKIGNDKCKNFKLQTESYTDLVHEKGNVSYNILDDFNTQANYTLEGNENSLTSLRLNGTTYKVDRPINVEANPTLAGTESDLEGIQIGDTKYKVPKGSYIVIPNSSSYITSDEFAYIDANYKTVPCYISHPDFGLYEVNHKQGTTLYSTLTSSTGFSNGNDGELKQLQVSSDDNYKVRATALPVKKVFANPTLSGGESSLTSLQVAGVKYKVEQPINVEANPTLAGAESDLEGIQIGDTKYKVGGGHLYEHHLSIKCIGINVEESAGVTKRIGTLFITIVLITNDSTQITTFESLNNVLSSYIRPCLTGAVNDSSGNSIKIFFESIEKYTGTGSQIKVYYINSEFSHMNAIANFDKVTDNVVQIL